MHPTDISALRAKLENFKLARLPLASKEILVGTPSEVARDTPEADRLELRAQLRAEREKVRQLEAQIESAREEARARD